MSDSAAGTPAPAPLSPASKKTVSSKNKRAAKPVASKPAEAHKIGKNKDMRGALDDDEIDPNYRQKLRVRGAVHIKEPLDSKYTRLGHINTRVRQMSKAEGFRYISSQGARVISHDATSKIRDILLVAASFASHQHRSMINDNDVKNAFAMVGNNSPTRIYSFGSLKQKHSHKRSFTSCKSDIAAAAKRRPHRQSFPVETKVKKAEKVAGPKAAKSSKARQ